ncbi:MAG TPA: COX15/CtaA family protein [Jatrophihabitans sp.]|nr:COX15/CtaA family protein [Jatrophihabitans sp.]
MALPAWTRAPSTLRRLALASVIANVVIVLTGGAVRLTGSGLGCPTWPSCTERSLTPTRQYAVHGLIEFTNRQLTFVLVVIVLATLAAAMLRRTERGLAVLLAASIPAQAVLGGITVLTKLNPWTVAAHFLLSIVIIAVAFLLWWRVREPARPPVAGRPALAGTGWLLLGLTGAVLVAGTVVTGSGPHAGDKGATHRIHIAPSSITQLHADLVMLLIGVTAGLVLLAGAGPVRRSGWWLLGIELAQGVIGYLQYFTGVPAALVALHMLGACGVWLAALTVLGTLDVRPFRVTDRARAAIAAEPQARAAEPATRA